MRLNFTKQKMESVLSGIFLKLYASRLLPIKMHGYSTNRQASTLNYFISFERKSQKTPKREIEKAKAERNDYLRRKETAKL